MATGGESPVMESQVEHTPDQNSGVVTFRLQDESQRHAEDLRDAHMQHTHSTTQAEDRLWNPERGDAFEQIQLVLGKVRRGWTIIMEMCDHEATLDKEEVTVPEDPDHHLSREDLRISLMITGGLPQLIDGRRCLQGH